MIGPFILMYHSIVDNSNDLYSVSVDSFREQISWLFDNEFEIVSLSFLLRSIQFRNFSALRKKVVITFDDGCKDFIDNALPILLEYKAPATVFLVTQLLGKIASWGKSGNNVQLMTKDEVRSIKSKGINLGSHSATHENMTLLDHQELQRQLKDSYDRLTAFGESFYTFAYPWGQWSNNVVDVLIATGYECAVAVGEQTRMAASDIYYLPRITMSWDMDLKRFQTLLTRNSIEMYFRRIYHKFRSFTK